MEYKTEDLVRDDIWDILIEAGYDNEELENFSLENLKDLLFLLDEGATKEEIVLL